MQFRGTPEREDITGHRREKEKKRKEKKKKETAKGKNEGGIKTTTRGGETFQKIQIGYLKERASPKVMQKYAR